MNPDKSHPTPEDEQSYVIPYSNVSRVGLMTRTLPGGGTESGFLIVQPDGTVKWEKA